MIFRTPVTPEKTEFDITYHKPIVLMGSCFADNIGHKLEQAYFPVSINPFGTLYNPISICNGLEIILNKDAFTEQEIFYDHECWHSFYHHSRFSHSNQKIFLDQINQELHTAKTQLKNAEYIILTLGTAWVYELKETGEVVANCHKLSSIHFTRRLLSIQEMINKMNTTFSIVKEKIPNIKILLTVSPIRHLADGASQNSLSKAILRVAVDQLCKSTNIAYFPSYEIMMDDLRDYRFYKEDMCHPSDQAIEYIWNIFADTFFSTETKKIIQAIEKLTLALQHRPFNPVSNAYITHIQKNIDATQKLSKTYPFLCLETLKTSFEEKLNSAQKKI